MKFRIATAVGAVTAVVATGVGLAPAQAHAAAMKVNIKTQVAIAYGSPYDSDLDGVPDAVFRPRFTAKVVTVCPAGVKAAMEFSPVTAHQIPATFFTCTGTRQRVKVLAASPHEPGVVHLTTRLLLDDGAGGFRRTGLEDAQDVTIVDVRMR